jgi:hypothetical protein
MQLAGGRSAGWMGVAVPGTNDQVEFIYRLG